MSYNDATNGMKLLWQRSVLLTGTLKHLLWHRLCSLILRAGTIKHSVEKTLAKGALAIVQRWNVCCEHRLIGKGRIDNLKGSFLDLFNLVIKVHGHTLNAYSRIGLMHAQETLTRTESRRAFPFNSRKAYKCLEAFLQTAFMCKFHFKSFEIVMPSNLACVTMLTI